MLTIGRERIDVSRENVRGIGTNECTLKLRLIRVRKSERSAVIGLPPPSRDL